MITALSLGLKRSELELTTKVKNEWSSISKFLTWFHDMEKENLTFISSPIPAPDEVKFDFV
jgi:hypothetical protein